MRSLSFKEKKKLLYQVSYVGVPIFIVWGALMFYDCAARPIIPSEEFGLMYPKQCHGATVFVSFTESILWIMLPILGFVFLGVLVVINRRLKRDDGWVLPVDSDNNPFD